MHTKLFLTLSSAEAPTHTHTHRKSFRVHGAVRLLMHVCEVSERANANRYGLEENI